MAKIKSSNNRLWGAIFALLCLAPVLGPAQVAATKASPPTAADRITELYNLVGSAGGQLPDWDKIRSLFLKEAIVILRSSRTTLTTFNLEGFIQDFIDFYNRPYKYGTATILPKESGFTEKIARMKAWEFGDMAHVLVLYEAQITGSPVRPQQGVDSWLLVRRDGQWRIAAITNEIVSAANPVPPELRDAK
jgi:hypothetical protein